jgi:hypothetical protein
MLRGGERQSKAEELQLLQKAGTGDDVYQPSLRRTIARRYSASAEDLGAAQPFNSESERSFGRLHIGWAVHEKLQSLLH